jgi:cytochrome d ubiquinol oxidase subunit I
VLGVSGFYFLKKKFSEHAKVMMLMSLFLISILAPLQIIVGDLHGLNTFQYQPTKIAAMEAQWETEKRAPLRLFALPDKENETNQFEISIPALSSLIITRDINGEIPGLKTWPVEDRPPVGILFWSFRIMVGLGVAMVLTAALGLFLYARKKIFHTPFFHRLCVLMGPSGFIAVIAGWIVAEVGRQPFTAYGVIRTSQSASPVIGPQIALSLAIFVASYFFIFGAGVTYIVHLLKKGPLLPQEPPPFQHQLEVVVQESFDKNTSDKGV